ncbi:DNA gyrase inhibitor YacG [Pseudaestuariivita atlantica]|uniref:DNA gyrase inhibitor n=1 Tax=Pseudaestuariivita atlantica TaxID=1317121 RepID=A0A0L1JU93_9RHOB|nr:DNA gyrase inhibitor YacG [Pseudaestuariivita atlantica]KNG95272.1 DNA gyrase inhibitor [Pseudaestuariivita atlantica]
MSCPICGDATSPTVRPFCSRRCADVDLARWLGGTYRVAGRDGEAEGVVEDADAPPRTH